MHLKAQRGLTRKRRKRKKDLIHFSFYLVFLADPSLPSCQGVPVELLRGPAPAGPHLDVGRARHDGQALHPLSDPLRRLRLAAGLRHRHGALRPAARGEIQVQVQVLIQIGIVCPTAAVIRSKHEYFTEAFREIFIPASSSRPPFLDAETSSAKSPHFEHAAS